MYMTQGERQAVSIQRMNSFAETFTHYEVESNSQTISKIDSQTNELPFS